MGYCDDFTHVCNFILCSQDFLVHFCESVSLDDQSRGRGERSSPVGNWGRKRNCGKKGEGKHIVKTIMGNM